MDVKESYKWALVLYAQIIISTEWQYLPYLLRQYCMKRRAQRDSAKKLQNLDTTQLNADFGNADIKSVICLVQEAEHGLIDSSVTKGYEHYNSS